MDSWLRSCHRARWEVSMHALFLGHITYCSFTINWRGYDHTVRASEGRRIFQRPTCSYMSDDQLRRVVHTARIYYAKDHAVVCLCHDVLLFNTFSS